MNPIGDRQLNAYRVLGMAGGGIERNAGDQTSGVD
jgi:hypothetical protein